MFIGERMMKKMLDKRFFSEIAIGILFLIATFVFLLKNPLHPWIDGQAGTDSSVFKTVALMMERGYMPYRDTFDHKGPLLYILNWLGNRISPYRGVWAIEFIAIFLTFYLIYKTARLCCNRMFSCVTVFASVSLLFEYFDGNMSEEYAMPLIALAQFIFLDYLINKRVTKLRLILCGLCFGAVCLLRVNMISVWVVFCIAIFILCIVNKQFCALKEFIIFFLLGFCLIVIPILFWLGANGALAGFWEDYIVFNRLYTASSAGRAILSRKWAVFFTFFNSTVMIFAVIISIYLCSIKDKFLYGTYLCYLFLSLLFICMSGMGYMHYGMVLVPAVSFPIASLFGIINQKKHEQIEKVLALIVTTYLMGVIVMPSWLELSAGIVTMYDDRESTNRSQTIYEISDYIKKNTLEDESISVYGNWDVIYVLSGRIHATKYSYLFPIVAVRPSIMDEYFEELKEQLPKIIVIQPGCYDDRVSIFLKENGYSLVWPENKVSMNGALMFEVH